MARLVFAMNLSLDGFVDHEAFAPDAELFRHWIEAVRSSVGCLYGRRLYEIMRYWDSEDPGWSPDERAFAEAWRGQRKWVVSGTLTSVGPKATLVTGDLGAAVRRLKDSLQGDLDVGGPALAGALGAMGLIDEYRLYYHPVVLGRGAPFFAGPLPRLRILSSDRIGTEAVRLTCVPT